MSSLREWFDIESPWLYGALMFVAWLLVARLVGSVFGESTAEAIDLMTIVAALAFAATAIYVKRRSTRRSASN